MNPKNDLNPPKKPYSAPKLRRFDLTQEEADRVRKSDDPMAELLKLKPDPLAGD